jgi:hypothetical protein
LGGLESIPTAFVTTFLDAIYAFFARFLPAFFAAFFAIGRGGGFMPSNGRLPALLALFFAAIGGSELLPSRRAEIIQLRESWKNAHALAPSRLQQPPLSSVQQRAHALIGNVESQVHDRFIRPMQRRAHPDRVAALTLRCEVHGERQALADPSNGVELV